MATHGLLFKSCYSETYITGISSESAESVLLGVTSEAVFGAGEDFELGLPLSSLGFGGAGGGPGESSDGN
jgi:hypothetical protein